ncbi:RNA polymerase subunit sigma-70 [Granulicoccus phenolivorans]|uniref:RNA polymerase subunit sigma-70 n=1 Tax=Granulicoccus phenolivorans TaxID=266854 RepID=UPI00041880C6|nr:RNA polymerase subunit sigma-70 [Granulicoccus phenolivorans]
MTSALDEAALARLRPELIGYCYRMLGDGAAAEDATQEILLRLWRARDRYDPRRAGLRTWAYAIATRYCIDVLRAAPRRALATDLVDVCRPGDPFGAPLPAGGWVTPLPDDPAEIAERRDAIRLAFAAALQRLTPRQRAVLILRDVYGYTAAETGELLGAGTAAVHSILQRARRALVDRSDPARDLPAAEIDPGLLAAFVTAFENHDVPALTALLDSAVVSSMPPVAFWVAGRTDVIDLFASGDGCRGHRLIPTTANARPAFGQYAPDGAGLRPFALLLLASDGQRITRMTTCLDLADRFPAFGLPARLPG